MKRLAIGFSLVLLGSCSVDTTGLAPEDLQFTAEPDTICPGDPSTLRWRSLNVPSSPDYCDEPYQTGQTCSFNSDCDSDLGERCIDFQCIGRPPLRDDWQEIDFGEGCPIDGEVRINQLTLATNEVVPDIENSDRIRGSKAVSPESTTVYTAVYDVEGARVATRSATVTVLGLDEATELINFGTFFCRDASGTLRRTLATSSVEFDPSLSVFLSLVTNETEATIIVSSGSPNYPPVRLSPGESTTDFNGRVPREWSVRLDPTEVPPPTSCTVDTGGFEPIEVNVALTVSCPN